MSELTFIEQLKKLITPTLGLYPDALGFSDDVCILGIVDGKTLIASSDSLCENIHFFSDDPIDLIIKKAIRTNISDIACKGATPYGMILNLCLPRRYHNHESHILIVQALQEDLGYYNLCLLGGDTTSSHALSISITIFGLCHHAIPHRKNIQLYDKIYVTGILGLAKIGLDLRNNITEAWSIKDNLDIYKNAYLLPNPPLKAGIAFAPYMNASMDISDGLLGDLQKMLNASNSFQKQEWGFKIDNTKIPYATINNDAYALDCALNGGDDYQILFTSDTDKMILFDIAHQYDIKLSCIGIIDNDKNEEDYQGFLHL